MGALIMDDLTIVFKKIKNRENEYILIFDTFHIKECIVKYCTLNKINDIENMLELISFVIQQYKITHLEIIIEDDEIEITKEMKSILRYCAF